MPSTESLYRQTLETRQIKCGADHPDTAFAQMNLASVLSNRDNLEEAKMLYRQALDTFVTKLGADHLNTASPQMNLAGLLAQSGDLDGAETNLDGVLSKWDSLDEAKMLYQQALHTFATKLGADHISTATIQHKLATLLEPRGDLHDLHDLHDLFG
jgi:tetratricopeptide (TPR) repeat protein